MFWLSYARLKLVIDNDDGYARRFGCIFFSMKSVEVVIVLSASCDKVISAPC